MKILGTSVEIERGDLARRRTFDFTLFICRELGVKLLGNRLRDLTLNGEYVRKIAVISLPP